ncbi:winged helix-turn-helix domain-containing protein [Cellulomonas sp. NS3]|uniref:winged helix-turn-helix domain-containing protein n=1 Tax=Cellulomonas sp. NS3 TaxID=2973977 RepID=UPI0021618126|nr:winged helix-turn-helix domain-containing protein [Cellulomonas sp. NS3]
MTTSGHPALLRSRTWPPPAPPLHRPHLLRSLLGPDAPPLAALVAPAGWGKTTLLADVTTTSTGARGWLTLDAGLRDPAALLAHLRHACTELTATREPWTTAEHAVAALHEPGPPGVLVLDDLHTLGAGPAADVVTLLLRHQPARLRVLLASRTTPAALLTRRLRGTATQLDADDLRLRSWEVAELARIHGGPVAASDTDELVRRTGGWPAGVELFHLATRRLPASRRRSVAGEGTDLEHEYLDRHVLGDLPDATREVLVTTSVLAHLTVARCTALLDTDGARQHLDTAHGLGLLTAEPGDPGRLRLTEPLRAHLLAALAHRDGPARTRALHAAAAHLAAADGDPHDALDAACRAHDHATVHHLLAVDGPALARRPGPWLDALPDVLRASDPWAVLALARRHLAEGDLRQASSAYRTALEHAATPADRAGVQRELACVSAWVPGADRLAVRREPARAALVTPDRSRAGVAAGDPPTLVPALAELVAGDPGRAAAQLGALLDAGTVPPVVEALALLARAAALSLTGDAAAHDARTRATTAAHLLRSAALERLADGLELACRPRPHPRALQHLTASAETAGDDWGAAVLGLLALCADVVRRSSTPEDADDVRARFEALGAPALAAWCTALAVVAHAHATARATPRTAGRHCETGVPDAAPGERAPRLTGVPAALVRLARTAGATDHATSPPGPPRTPARVPADGGVDGGADDRPPTAGTGAPLAPSGRSWLDAVARSLEAPGRARPPAPAGSAGVVPLTAARRVATHGAGPAHARTEHARLQPRGPVAAVDLATRPHALVPPAPSPLPPLARRTRLVVRCLGGFSLVRDGRPVSLTHLRPQHQALLRALCAHAGAPVNRDRLLEWFWPGRDPERAQHSLQVAVSELRKLLEPATAGARGSVICRDAGGYGLQLGPDDEHDARTFERLLHDARISADGAAGTALYQAAVDAYPADLLPDDGVSEWVVHERERLRSSAVSACRVLADRHARAGDHAAAIQVCRRGLAVDAYQDGLWQRLALSLDEAGEPAAAAAARRAYAGILRELDVLVGPGPGRPAAAGRAVEDPPRTAPVRAVRAAGPLVASAPRRAPS